VPSAVSHPGNSWDFKQVPAAKTGGISMPKKRRIGPGDYEIRKVIPGDEKELTALREKVWKKTAPESYWKWKYYENPFGGHYSYVGVVDGTIMALAGGVCYKYRLNRHDLVVVQSFDWEALSRQAAGLFLETIKVGAEKMAQDGLAFHYGFTNSNSTPFCTQRLGYLPGFSVTRLDRPVNAEKLYKSTEKMGLKAKMASLCSKAMNLFDYEKSVKGFRLVEVTDFDERFDRLWSAAGDGFSMTTVRTKEYLRWRYLEHPVYKYSIVAAEAGDDVLGFIVFRKAEEDDKGIIRGYLVDLFTVLDQSQVWDALISRAVRQLINRKVDIISCWMLEHSPYYNGLKKHFFFKRNADLITMSHSFIESISDEFLHRPESWYFTMGDSDIF
jgi:hypothetical protein